MVVISKIMYGKNRQQRLIADILLPQGRINSVFTFRLIIVKTLI